MTKKYGFGETILYALKIVTPTQKIAEDYEKLKEKLDQEIKLLEDNSEEEGTRMDSGIEIREQDEQNDEMP